MRAAATAVRQRMPRKLVVAVPVGSPETCDAFRDHVDEIVCAITPDPLYGVGLWYTDFSQTSDDEVRKLLVFNFHRANGVANRRLIHRCDGHDLIPCPVHLGSWLLNDFNRLYA